MTHCSFSDNRFLLYTPWMKKLLLVLPLLLTGCPSQAMEPKGPTPVPRDTDACGTAGAQLEDLKCRDRNGDPMWVNKHGEKFEQTCRTLQEEGGIFINPKCITLSKTCEEAKACPPTSE
jgi:hypothetical protein